MNKNNRAEFIPQALRPFIKKGGTVAFGLVLVIIMTLSIGLVDTTKPRYACAAAGNSGGGEIAPQPCDPRYWETMSARAWMEAEREIMQNQNLIFKPDSVLEYTCFDKMVSHGAKYLGDIFVHTDYFGKVIIERGTAQAQEIALQNVVSDSLKDYIANNYPYNYLADRSPQLTNKPSTTNRASNMEDAKSMTKYSSCDIMAQVWQASKCINFVDDKDKFWMDGFYPFITLQPGPEGGPVVTGYSQFGDVRYWPKKCETPLEGQRWTDENKTATNENDAQYKFRDPLKTDFEKVRKMVEPGGCSENEQGIETGVTVILSGSGSGKADKVCTNPGCTYLDNKCQ